MLVTKNHLDYVRSDPHPVTVVGAPPVCDVVEEPENPFAGEIWTPNVTFEAMEATPEWEKTRWWRVISPSGSLWNETSDEQEARDSMREGDVLQRLYQKTDEKWVSEK